jgi:hypothetical protein
MVTIGRFQTPIIGRSSTATEIAPRPKKKPPMLASPTIAHRIAANIAKLPELLQRRDV